MRPGYAGNRWVVDGLITPEQSARFYERRAINLEQGCEHLSYLDLRDGLTCPSCVRACRYCEGHGCADCGRSAVRT